MIAANKTPISVSVSAERRILALDGTVCAAADGEGAYTFGFERADGALHRGCGADVLFSDGAEDARSVYFAEGAAALWCESGALYVRGETAFSDSGVRFSAPPRAFPVADGSGRLLLSDGQTSALFGADGAAEIGLEAFGAAAYSYDRLWLGDGARLRFSAPENIADFAGMRAGGGYIAVPDAAGAIEALCPYEEYLYVFRARGIQRLTARGDELDFALRDVCVCPRLYGGTVAAAEEEVVFLTDDGLYGFDGTRARAFAEEFAPFFAGVEQSDPRAVVFRGRYYLQARARIDGAAEDVLAVFRTDGSSGYLLRRGVTGLFCDGSAVFCVYEGKPCVLTDQGAFAGTYGRAVWSCGVDAPASRGVFRSLCMRADGVFAVTVRSERGERFFRYEGNGVRTMPVRLPGERFVVRIESDGAGTVYALSARFAAQGGSA